MKLGISGSRTITDRKWIKQQINQAIDCCYNDVGIFLIGDCPTGVDFEATQLLKEYELKIFKADWDTFGTYAGPERNEKIVKEADFVLCLLDKNAKCKGTKSTIALCLKHNKPFNVRVYNG